MTTFIEIQKKLNHVLQPLVNERMDDVTMHKAQQEADCVFRAQLNQRKFVLLGDSGVQLTACKLRFHFTAAGVGSLGVERWITAFYPSDVNKISTRYPDSVALGYVNDAALFMLKGELCAERQAGRGVERYVVDDNAGLPPATSVLYIAYARAQSLGYVKKRF